MTDVHFFHFHFLYVSVCLLLDNEWIPSYSFVIAEY